ncbi:DNA/RNA endonuclease G, NUC1 [Prosthecobacter debontii]|uniref:DNA/RNA endonuclease G, NUC1 n=1 Tax=Prosthecobacter debontii TaxID=48467 RepID=A0A1T4XZI2_9BACT|nr:DNA/RNA non-specific endonuclease [Prosthecobacter debontii]SKA94628.1 DNA/RNA endonuclease G, NUC1 [Prosthecobacter debontii]
MALPTYPANTVWYLEARPMNVGWAPENPSSMGSAVAVELEHLNEQGRPLRPARVRKYLLTCAHVCRQPTHDGVLGWGPLLGELLCFPPGSKYQRTTPNGRNSGQLPGPEVMLAKVVAQCPSGASMGSVDLSLREAKYDWVLLDVQDPDFQKVPVVRRWAATLIGKRLDIIGYPGGAGIVVPKGRGEYWETGDAVESYLAEDFAQKRTPDEGMLKPEGKDETRPGMSGGGVFTSTGELAGIHCSSTDQTLSRGAVSAEFIQQWLKDQQIRPGRVPLWERVWEMDFLPSFTLPRVPRGAWFMGVAGLLSVALLIERYALPPKTYDLAMQVAAKRDVDDIKKLLPGLLVSFEPDPPRPELVVTPGTTDHTGKASIRVSVPRGASTDSLRGYLVCKNAPGPMNDHAPLILEPYGSATQGIHSYKSSDELDLAQMVPTQIKLPTVVATGLRAWSKERFGNLMGTPPEDLLKQAQATGEDLTLPSSASSFSDRLDASKLLMAKQGVGEEEFVRVAKDWVKALLTQRPVLRVQSQVPYYNRDQADKNKRSVASVGVIYGAPDASGLRPLGSAFVVGRDVILTAQSVMTIPSESGFEIAFTDQAEPPARARLKLGAVLWQDRQREVCLVEVEGTLPPPLPLASKLPKLPVGRSIYVAGYPFRDSRLPDEVSDLFRSSYGARCVIPGELIEPPLRQATEAQDSRADSHLHYDATTSGGTGGSPVIDLLTQAVFAIHSQGIWDGDHKNNHGPSLATLAQDQSFNQLILQHGGRFVTVGDAVLAETADSGPVEAAAVQLTVPYDADFLGVNIPLPTHADGPSEAPLDYVYYSLVMAPERRMARYAVCNVDRHRMLSLARTGDRWYRDSRLPLDQQMEAAFFVGNEWDRGHLCRASSLRWGEVATARSAYQSAFFLTNATPQHAYFNQGTWLRLERSIYDELHPDSARITVFSGPVFRDSDIEYRGYRIPRSYWMVALYQNESDPAHPHVEACLAHQYTLQPDGGYTPLARSMTGEFKVYATSVQAIEQETGLTFTLPTNSGQ